MTATTDHVDLRQTLGMEPLPHQAGGGVSNVWEVEGYRLETYCWMEVSISVANCSGVIWPSASSWLWR